MNSSVSRMLYFYATNEAAFYDDTVRFTDRAYDLIHEVTQRVIESWLAQQHNESSGESPLYVLDIGCGTGAEAMQLLLRFPGSKVFCVDNSTMMLDIFRQKLYRAYGDDTACGRVSLIEADFREIGWLDRVVAQAYSLCGLETFDLAISVYALHHLVSDTKLDVYRAINRKLRPCSLFVNADLFSYSTPWLADLAQQEEENWITQQFSDTSSESLLATLGPARAHLTEAWLDHVRRENVPLPITIEEGRCTSSHVCEEGLLNEAGFRSLVVPARLYQSGVLVATK